MFEMSDVHRLCIQSDYIRYIATSFEIFTQQSRERALTYTILTLDICDVAKIHLKCLVRWCYEFIVLALNVNVLCWRFSYHIFRTLCCVWFFFFCLVLFCFCLLVCFFNLLFMMSYLLKTTTRLAETWLFDYDNHFIVKFKVTY